MLLTRSIKVVMMGEVGVGKTSVATRLVRDQFCDFQDSTIGAAFFHLERDDTRVEIWDTAGQERYRSLVPMYVRGAGVLVLVVDVKDPRTLTTLMEPWRDMLPHDCEVVVVRNKADLLKGAAPAEFVDDAQELSIEPILASAKTGEGCEELLSVIISLAKPIVGPTGGVASIETGGRSSGVFRDRAACCSLQ